MSSIESGKTLDFLRENLSRIQLDRPEYSLRAYSKRLGITPSQLSELFSGKRKLTRKIAYRICENLALDSEFSKRLIESLPSRQTRNRANKGQAITLHKNEDSSSKWVLLSSDHFRMISDWYYLAVLSLAEVRGFQSEPQWIAKRLGITAREAKAALDTLIRLKMLKKSRKGWIPTGETFRTTSDIPDSSIRKNHFQSLEQAAQSLRSDPIELREISGSILAIDPKRVPEVKQLLREFKRGLSERLSLGPKREVYRLNFQFFPISKSVKGDT